MFSMYKLLYRFLGEYYKLDTTLLLALIQDSGLPLRDTIHKISCIHSGYVDVVSSRIIDNARSDEES